MKALFDYDAQDVDELSLKVGQLIDLVREGGGFRSAPAWLTTPQTTPVGGGAG